VVVPAWPVLPAAFVADGFALADGRRVAGWPVTGWLVTDGGRLATTGA
jgi:hypothetical protein